MRPVIWLIGGTSEGRRLLRDLADLPVQIYVSVATAYGASLIEPQANATVLAKRYNLEEMVAFLRNHRPTCVIDATHPYATIVTATVQQACAQENTAYIRLLRPTVGDEHSYISVQDFAEAVELLNHVEGNVFLTTGSKNLPDFTQVKNYQERIALRVLPMQASLEKALSLGYKPAQIVCMQGPFAKELNVCMLKKFHSAFMVTKDSGEAGGFLEKVAAAEEAGAKLIVIGRATQESGSCYAEIVANLRQQYQVEE